MGKFLVKSIQGKRDYMEDRWAYYESDGISVAMVADGHGGDKMANKTSIELPHLLIKNLLKSGSSSTSKAVTIKNTIEDYGNANKLENSGCTLTGFVKDNDKIYVFNVGDSRTLVHLNQKTYIYYLTPENSIQILQNSFLETRDHTPENPEEIKRVKEMGGNIYSNRLNGVLAVTKALGDNGVGKGISYSPDIFWVNTEFVKSPIVLFSDGIYDAFSKTDDVLYTNHFLYHLGETYGAEGMVFWATKVGSGDNITCLVVNI